MASYKRLYAHTMANMDQNSALAVGLCSQYILRGMKSLGRRRQGQKNKKD
jgi:hypothetical protein